MAKGKKSPTPKSPEPVVDDEVLKKASVLKEEATRLFAGKDFGRALDAYDSALKLLPPGHALRPDLAHGKGACLVGLNKLKEAAREFSAILEGAPGNARALRGRAKALEKQGLFKQALADIQAVNRGADGSAETREAEARLRGLVAGRRPSLANGGARAAGGGGAAAAARGARSPMQFPFSAKVSLGGETRLIQLTASAGYADLLSAVAAKFPNAGHVVAKYVDREGDLVTIACRTDLQHALGEALQAADRRLGVAGIPPIKVQLTQVADKSDVPPIPLEEVAEAQQRLLAQQQQQQQQQALAAHQATQAAAQQQQQQGKQVAHAVPSGELVEIDDWLVELITMVKDASGIDPDKHVDPLNEGYFALQRAADATVRSEEAAPLFDRAAERFREVAAQGYVQWGNVHTHKAHRALDLAALAGEAFSPALAKAVAAEYAEAAALYDKALGVKGDSVDALLAMAALEVDRAKAAARLLVKPSMAAEQEASAAAQADGASDAEAAKAAQEVALAATREGLANIKAADVKAAAPHVASAREWYGKALAAARAAEEARKKEGASDAAKGKGEEAAAANGSAQQQQQQQDGDQQQPELVTLASHAQVMHGNSLYEWSQALAAAGDASWRALLDEAAALFREAGCAEGDIRNALKNHTQADQLDLGPDPEPEPEPAAEQQQQQQKQQHKAAPEAKGLPKLERKPKDKAAA